MTPRAFLDFFKTKSGKLVLFGIVLSGILMLFSALRDKVPSDSLSGKTTKSPVTNKIDKPQVVQTVERPMELYRPPAPKSEPPTPPPKSNEPPKVVPESRRPEPPPAPLVPISLFADSTVGVAEPKTPGSVYAPFGRLIPCETIITVDSSSILTPIIGLITEDIYHAGRLVIPAGTEAHGTAQTDRKRERIASGTAWTLVWQTGEEMRLRAIALDREFAGGQEGWGITDGSAGLRGRLLKTDDLAEVKLFAATLLGGMADALTEKETTLFGSIDRRSINNAPLKGAQEVINVYAQRILDAIQRDGFYVRVPSGKQFYLYSLETIDRSSATIGGASKPFVEESLTAQLPSAQPVVYSDALVPKLASPDPTPKSLIEP
jgi:hypothetical protein